MRAEYLFPVCVSCGRCPGATLDTHCPYCDELLWQPRWLRVLRLTHFVVIWLSLPLALYLLPTPWLELRFLMPGTPIMMQLGCGLALGLLLIPAGEERVVVNSISRLIKWRIRAMAVGLWFATPLLWLNMMSAPDHLMRVGYWVLAGIWICGSSGCLWLWPTSIVQRIAGGLLVIMWGFRILWYAYG